VLPAPINELETLILANDQSVFTIDFAALNYKVPEKNQYQYTLEGFDKDWSPVGTRRSATYTNLDPGEYVFRVRASNNDGVWNETGKSLGIIITPPWWETWWFRSLALMLVLGLIAGGYRWRTRAIKRQNLQLEEEVSTQTRDLQEANQQLKSEIEKRIQVELKLQELAITDSLTGLYNRRHFFELAEKELSRALRYNRHFSLILVDIDRFKDVNDQFGHLYGDRVLEITARCISQNSRDVDIPGRYGGDEFVILVPETPQPHARVLAERLCRSVPAQLAELEELTEPVTLSIGIAPFRGETDMHIDTLFERADQSLYAAKDAGRNSIIVWEEK